MSAISALSGPLPSSVPAPASSSGISAKADGSSSGPAPKSVYTLQEDGVHISPGALVAQLHSQGQNALSIAATTGISVSEVNCYLGVTVQNAQQSAAIDARIASAGKS